MKVNLIIIGNELLNGKIQDLNSHFLAKTLFNQNHNLHKVIIIQDNEKDFEKAIASSLVEADAIITSGGLGPTKDDLTKNMLAKFFKKEIKISASALELVKKQYESKERNYNEHKHHYHFVPIDFELIENKTGFAPALYYLQGNKHIFALPGVPLEFQSLLTDTVLPTLNKNTSETLFQKHISFKTWKIPESVIFHELCPDLWDSLTKFGEVSSLPHFYGVDIGVKVTTKSQDQLDAIEKKMTELMFASAIKENTWQVGNLSLEEFIVFEAKRKKIKIGFAESCTGGLLADSITNVSGCSDIFWGSVTSYSNEVKINVLGVNEKTLLSHGAVSEQTALEMAIGAKDKLNLDIAISTTGIAGPGGGSTEKPVGTVGIGVASQRGVSSKIYHFHGSRINLKKRFATTALIALLEELNQL